MNDEGKKLTRPTMWRRMVLFFSIMGPGIITANVDNDAGGLATYSQAGALFGLNLLWSFLPITVALIVVQEMVNRMGVVTGEGLSSLIRERFGVKTTFYLMLVLLLTNFGNIVAEFAGIASSAQLFGIPPLIAVPACAVLVWLLVLRWNYKAVERVFLVACLFYASYLITCFMVKPDLHEVAHAFVTPRWVHGQEYLMMIIGLVGTTIAPWMQFYQQASVVEKNIDLDHYAYSKADTVLGGILVNVVAVSILIVCAMTLYPANIRIETAAQAAQALEPLAGRHAEQLFAFGLLNASVFAASILPLSTAYSVCEALGWERGVDKDYREAPHFYVLYTALIALGALIVLIPGISYIGVMLLSQVGNGLLLPAILIFMLILVNDKRMMGAYTNRKIYNIVCIGMASALSLICAVYVISLFL
jgi:NRAMP (natural resistance-associated macrophage protein)-like metal ion transporter